MRRFHSYGPVDQDIHFCVPRSGLVENCFHSIVGEPGKSGHFFTIWAPRQTGKTWLMHQVKQRIEQESPFTKRHCLPNGSGEYQFSNSSTVRTNQ